MEERKGIKIHRKGKKEKGSDKLTVKVGCRSGDTEWREGSEGRSKKGR